MLAKAEITRTEVETRRKRDIDCIYAVSYIKNTEAEKEIIVEKITEIESDLGRHQTDLYCSKMIWITNCMKYFPKKLAPWGRGSNVSLCPGSLSGRVWAQ